MCDEHIDQTWSLDCGAKVAGTNPLVLFTSMPQQGPVEQMYLLGVYADTTSSPLLRVEMISTTALQFNQNAISSVLGATQGGFALHLTLPGSTVGQMFQDYSTPRPLLAGNQFSVEVPSIQLRITDFAGADVTFTRLVLHLGIRRPSRHRLEHHGARNYTPFANALMNEY